MNQMVDTAKKSARVHFNWEDPFLLEQQLTEEERMIRDSAHAYCQDKLMTRVLEQFRHETTDPTIFREMGELGLLTNHSRTIRWRRFKLCQLWFDCS